MLVVITIPAWNEEHTLPSVLHEIQSVMNVQSYKYKILVVDDGSTDNTAEVARKAGALVVRERHAGLVDTFKTEMRECLKLSADVIVHTDADGQYPAHFIPQMIQEVEKGNDLVLGSRFRGRIEMMPLIKRLGNMAFARVFTKICRTPITDSTTGFRTFTREVAQNIEYTTDFTYTQEQLIKASRLNFKIVEIPVDARKTRGSRLMKGPFDYAIKAWINLLRIYRDYRPLAFFGKIGVVLISLGSLLSLYIVYTFLTAGVVGGVPRVVLAALLIMTGLQVILFGFLADMRR